MKNLITGVLLIALCLAPSVAQAAVVRGPETAPAVSEASVTLSTTPGLVASTSAGTSDYAAREAAAPQLAEFAGGSGGVYIGTGVLVVALIVVLAVLILR